jgi:hypothetical protein
VGRGRDDQGNNQKQFSQLTGIIFGWTRVLSDVARCLRIPDHVQHKNFRVVQYHHIEAGTVLEIFVVLRCFSELFFPTRLYLQIIFTFTLTLQFSEFEIFFKLNLTFVIFHFSHVQLLKVATNPRVKRIFVGARETTHPDSLNNDKVEVYSGNRNDVGEALDVKKFAESIF